MNKIFFIILVTCNWIFTEAQTYKLHLKPGKNRIYVDSVFINGNCISGVFVFDTGASKSFIASSALDTAITYKKKWGVHKYAKTYYGRKRVSYRQFSEIRIGELRLNDFKIRLVDWEEFNNPCFEEQTMGLIGLDIIKKYHWFFDLEKHIGYASEQPINSVGYNYFEIKKQFNGLLYNYQTDKKFNKLYIHMDKNSLKDNPFQKNKFLLDTGSPSDIIINYKEEKLPEGIEVNMLFSNTIIKEFRSINEITINNANYTKEVGYSQNIQTSVGLGFFRQSKIILPKDLTKIYYSKLVSDSLDIPKTGFKITKEKDDNIKIGVLYKNSPAEKAGLKLGNTITQINDTYLVDIDCLKLNDFMKEESKKNKMSVKLKDSRIILLSLD